MWLLLSCADRYNSVADDWRRAKGGAPLETTSEQTVSDTHLCEDGSMSMNDPAGSPGGEARKAAKMRELIRVAERNYRRTEQSRERWPETVVALEQADETTIDDVLARAKAVDSIYDAAAETLRLLG